MLRLSILLKSSTLKSKYSIKITSELFPMEDFIQLRFVCESKPYQYFPKCFCRQSFSGFNVWLVFLSFSSFRVRQNSRKTISIFLMPSSSRLVFCVWFDERREIIFNDIIKLFGEEIRQLVVRRRMLKLEETPEGRSLL